MVVMMMPLRVKSDNDVAAEIVMIIMVMLMILMIQPLLMMILVMRAR